MARIAIVGGHGKVAQQLIEQLTAQGDSPVALVRKQEYEAELVALMRQLFDEADGNYGVPACTRRCARPGWS